MEVYRLTSVDKKPLVIAGLFLLICGIASSASYTVDSEEDWREGTFHNTTVTDNGTLRMPITDLSDLRRYNKSPGDIANTPLVLDLRLLQLTEEQMALEKEIINTNPGFLFWRNTAQIQSFSKRYRNQLEKVNCYRRIKVGDTGCIGSKVLTSHGWSDEEEGFFSMYLASSYNSERLDVAISNSKRIRERLRTLRQNNLSRVAILVSLIALLITLIAETPYNTVRNAGYRAKNLVTRKIDSSFIQLFKPERDT